MKTRCVAGAAYSTTKSCLTHTVTDDGKPLCGKVKASNILDDAFATDEDAAPTCPHCLKRDSRFSAVA